MDCNYRTGYYEFQNHQTGASVPWSSNVRTNMMKYRRTLTDSWSGYIAGAASYGYYYNGMDDDKWEESIGWAGYGNSASDPNYGQHGGCVGPKDKGSNSGGMRSGKLQPISVGVLARLTLRVCHCVPL